MRKTLAKNGFGLGDSTEFAGIGQNYWADRWRSEDRRYESQTAITRQSKRDPSSQKALLWMTAKGGLCIRTGRLGEADRIGGGTKKTGD
jgi:hypothetical protein